MIYKKQVIQELISMDDVCMAPFYERIKKVTFNSHRLIRHHKGKKYSYYCTHCHCWHEDKMIKLKEVKECVHCHKKFEVVGYRNVIKEVDGYLISIEKNNRNELIIRSFYFVHWYEKENQRFHDICYEVMRVNVDRNASIKKDTYYAMGNGYRHAPNTKKWGENKDTYSYYGGKCNIIYTIPFNEVVTTGIKMLLKTTPYKFSALDIAARNHIDIYEYLKKYKEYNELELLLKARCFNLLNDVLFNRCSVSLVRGLFENKRVLKLAIQYNLPSKEIEYANKLNLSDKKMIKFATKLEINHIPEGLKRDRLINYLKKQKANFRYYMDYFNMANEAGFPMYKREHLYPDNLLEEHDRALKEVKIVRDIKIAQGIEDYSHDLAEYEWKYKNLYIRPARTQDELIEESEKLKHCVRQYAKDVSNRETAIFFIRDARKIDEPYVTLELRGKRVAQVRGFDNDKTKPLAKSVVNFVKSWEQKFQFTGY